MTSALKGIELIDCARANAAQGIETAASLCGYSNDLAMFEQELKQACGDIGVDIQTLGDLITDRKALIQSRGIVELK